MRRGRAVRRRREAALEHVPRAGARVRRAWPALGQSAAGAGKCAEAAGAGGSDGAAACQR